MKELFDKVIEKDRKLNARIDNLDMQKISLPDLLKINEDFNGTIVDFKELQRLLESDGSTGSDVLLHLLILNEKLNDFHAMLDRMGC